MLKIGCHLSSSKGFLAMAETAEKIGGTTFQFFTRNPRGAKAKALDVEDVNRFLERAGQLGIGPIVAHAPYTLNACGAEERVREFALETMADDLARMEYLPGNYYNFHPGSHVKQGAETGIRLIAETLNAVLKPEQHTTVLLETMAGKGSEVGRSFEELREILDRVELSRRSAGRNAPRSRPSPRRVPRHGRQRCRPSRPSPAPRPYLRGASVPGRRAAPRRERPATDVPHRCRAGSGS